MTSPVIMYFRYARSVGLAESVSARKFLEAAMGSGDEQVFYSTFTFFSLRNTRLRGSAAFARGSYVFLESAAAVVTDGASIALTNLFLPLFLSFLFLLQWDLVLQD